MGARAAVPPEPVGDLVEVVAAWFGADGRDLPWRRTRDPWAVLVSELMLQQTGVARVEPRFEAFLDRFPTPTACAEGSRRRRGRDVAGASATTVGP